MPTHLVSMLINFCQVLPVPNDVCVEQLTQCYTHYSEQEEYAGRAYEICTTNYVAEFGEISGRIQ